MPSRPPQTCPGSISQQRTLDNGLRVIVAPDHLAPVVAINIWYVVGSRHEQPGRTGFAHLFEHFMFQGSRHVTKAEHFSIIQSAGGVNNATTYFDRTNYFETLPSHQLELALWLEADRMATLLDALDQENLDNQREVVKNEKRQSYDNRPYGSFYEKLMAAVFPPDHPYHHTPIGSMEDLDAASLDDVITLLQDLVRAQQRGADDRRRRRRGGRASRRRSAIRAHPGQPNDPAAARGRHRAASIGARGARDGARRVPLTRVHFGFRMPALRHGRVRRARGRLPDPGRRPRIAPLPAAGARASGSPRTWPRSRCRSSTARRLRRLGHGPTGERCRRPCETAFLEELAAAGRRAGHRR